MTKRKEVREKQTKKNYATYSLDYKAHLNISRTHIDI